MDSSLLDLLTKVTVYDLIITLILVATMVGILISQRKRLSKLLDKWRRDKNEEEDFQQLVYSLKDSVAELKTSMTQYQQNRERDREDSRKIRDEMYKVMNKQSNGIEELKKAIVEMERRNSKTKRAELKERIEKIYSECHPTMTCTEMAFETLRDLIEEYEAHGGVNSFVHTVVEPEMHNWKKVSRI